MDMAIDPPIAAEADVPQPSAPEEPRPVTPPTNVDVEMPDASLSPPTSLLPGETPGGSPPDTLQSFNSISRLDAKERDMEEPPRKRAKSMYGGVEVVLGRTAEIVVVLSGMATLRAGSLPTPIEHQLAAEAYEKLASLVENIAPHQLVSKDSLRSLIQHLSVPPTRPPLKSVSNQPPAVAPTTARETVASPPTEKVGPKPSESLQSDTSSRNDEVQVATIIKDQGGQAPKAQARQRAKGGASLPLTEQQTTHQQLALAVQLLIKQRPPPLPAVPISTAYMSPAVACGICKVVAHDTASLLVCDGCEAAFHVVCLQSYNQKGIPKSDWYCPKCVIASNGRPQPPKYGPLRRGLTSQASTRGSWALQAGRSSEAAKVQTAGKPLLLPQRKSDSEAEVVLETKEPVILKTQHPALDNSKSIKGGSLASKLEVQQRAGESPGGGLTEAPSVTTAPGPAASIGAPGTSGVTTAPVASIGTAATPGVTTTPATSAVTSSTLVWTTAPAASIVTPATSTVMMAPTPSVVTVSTATPVVTTAPVAIPVTAATSGVATVPTPSVVSSATPGVMTAPEQSILTTATPDVTTAPSILTTTSTVTPAAPGVVTSVTENDTAARAKNGGGLESIVNVEWSGPVVNVSQGNVYYAACSVAGVILRLQDCALFRPETPEVPPYIARLQALWEDESTGAKWVKVNWCYYPSDLPLEMGRPASHDPNEVYESNHSDNNLVGSIQGPCEVLAPLQYEQEIERRSKGGGEGLPPIFLCRWLYDAPRGVFQAAAEGPLKGLVCEVEIAGNYNEYLWQVDAVVPQEQGTDCPLTTPLVGVLKVL